MKRVLSRGTTFFEAIPVVWTGDDPRDRRAGPESRGWKGARDSYPCPRYGAQLTWRCGPSPRRRWPLPRGFGQSAVSQNTPSDAIVYSRRCSAALGRSPSSSHSRVPRGRRRTVRDYFYERPAPTVHERPPTTQHWRLRTGEKITGPGQPRGHRRYPPRSRQGRVDAQGTGPCVVYPPGIRSAPLPAFHAWKHALPRIERAPRPASDTILPLSPSSLSFSLSPRPLHQLR